MVLFIILHSQETESEKIKKEHLRNAESLKHSKNPKQDSKHLKELQEGS